MTCLSIFNWSVIFIALFGAYLNSKQRIEGFFLWVISNSYLMVYNLMINETSQAILFFAYLVITLNGILVWSQKGAPSKKKPD